MIRRAAAVLLALTLYPASLHAQDTVLTVTVQSADVHKTPSTASPVIGHAARGTTLTVSRNLGSWVQVPWSASPDGIGYLHVTTGRVGVSGANPSAPNARPSAQAATASVPVASSSFSGGPAPVPMANAQRTPASAGDRLPPSNSRISHVVGLGGIVGPMSTFGATARWWHDKHLGVQAGFTRDSMTSETAPGEVTSMQMEPAVVYALFDRVPAYLWIRPYVGSGLSFRHQSLTVPAPDPTQPSSDNGVGYRLFGGGELTFASVTQFGLSAEVGYRHLPAPFAGFEPDHLNFSIAGHWYIK
jgi:outer membrane protein W